MGSALLLGITPRAAARPAEPLAGTQRLLLLPPAPSAPGAPALDTAEIARSLGAFLAAHRVEARVGAATMPPSFPEQVRAARAQGASHRALAVVWFQLVPLGGLAGEAELYLHLLDRVTDKALVKTLKVTGRVGPDFYRAVALKILGLLRAALLEVRADRRDAAPIWGLVGPPPGVRPASGPTPQPYPTPRHPGVHLEIGYRLGFFGAARHLHHGVGADVEIGLYRWLGLAASVTVPQPFLEDHPLASLALTPYRAAITARLGWTWSRVALLGELGPSLLVLSARRTSPSVPPWSRVGWDPGGRLGARFLWTPLPRLALAAGVSVDLLGRTQRVRSGGTTLLTLPWAAVQAGLGLRVSLR